MKNLDLKQMGVKELSVREQQEVEGGFWLFVTAALIVIGIGAFIGQKIWQNT